MKKVKWSRLSSEYSPPSNNFLKLLNLFFKVSNYFLKLAKYILKLSKLKKVVIAWEKRRLSMQSRT